MRACQVAAEAESVMGPAADGGHELRQNFDITDLKYTRAVMQVITL